MLSDHKERGAHGPKPSIMEGNSSANAPVNVGFARSFHWMPSGNSITVMPVTKKYPAIFIPPYSWPNQEPNVSPQGRRNVWILPRPSAPGSGYSENFICRFCPKSVFLFLSVNYVWRRCRR